MQCPFVKTAKHIPDQSVKNIPAQILSHYGRLAQLFARKCEVLFAAIPATFTTLPIPLTVAPLGSLWPPPFLLLSLRPLLTLNVVGLLSSPLEARAALLCGSRPEGIVAAPRLGPGMRSNRGDLPRLLGRPDVPLPRSSHRRLLHPSPLVRRRWPPLQLLLVDAADFLIARLVPVILPLKRALLFKARIPVSRILALVGG